MDAQKTINEVVDGVKSEGLFDQFRKECLEEFESMETYHQLKQRVENHVTSFLSKHKYHDGLQKNMLRSNLRHYISKSEVLLNGITQLVDEVLSLKGKSFCLRIDKHVDKHLSKKSTVVSPEKTVSGSDKSGHSDVAPLQNGLPVVESNVNNDHKSDVQIDNEEVIVEEQKDVVSNETVTEFTEMEIEEVEMDLSENQELHLPFEDEGINEEHSRDDVTIESVEFTQTPTDETELDVKVKTEIPEVMDATVENNANLSSLPGDDVENNMNEIKKEPDNMFKPIMVEMENMATDLIPKVEIKQEIIESDTTLENNEYEGKFEDNDEDMQSSLNLPPIITEPITDDSNSNDSTFAENIKIKLDQYMSTSEKEIPGKKEDTDCRRKSSRVRTLPLKFREIDEIRKRTDDADSVSSNDIDYKDLEDGTYLIGKRGRPRKRPQSAGNPETTTGRADRRSSASSRTSVDTTRRRKRSPSISKQEAEAINFLTKPEVRKSLTREGKTLKDDSERSSRSTRERVPDPRESRDENSSEKDDSDRYSRSGSRRKSESEKDERKSERDRKSTTRDGSSSGKDEEVKTRRDRNTSSTADAASSKEDANRNTRSKRDHKSESGEGSYSSIDDDDKNNRSKRDKNVESRDVTSSGKDNEDRKSRDRRDRKSSGSGKDDDRSTRKDDERSTRKDDERSTRKDDDRSTRKDDDRSTRNKRDNKSDFSTNHSEKDDSERKSRTKREDNTETRDERDSLRNTYRKRFHSPAPSLEEGLSKRSRRSIKQRQRYTPP